MALGWCCLAHSRREAVSTFFSLAPVRRWGLGAPADWT